MEISHVANDIGTREAGSLIESKRGQSYSGGINFHSFTIEPVNEELSLDRYFFLRHIMHHNCLRIGENRTAVPAYTYHGRLGNYFITIREGRRLMIVICSKLLDANLCRGKISISKAEDLYLLAKAEREMPSQNEINERHVLAFVFS